MTIDLDEAAERLKLAIDTLGGYPWTQGMDEYAAIKVLREFAAERPQLLAEVNRLNGERNELLRQLSKIATMTGKPGCSTIIGGPITLTDQTNYVIESVDTLQRSHAMAQEHLESVTPDSLDRFAASKEHHQEHHDREEQLLAEVERLQQVKDSLEYFLGELEGKSQEVVTEFYRLFDPERPVKPMILNRHLIAELKEVLGETLKYDSLDLATKGIIDTKLAEHAAKAAAFDWLVESESQVIDNSVLYDHPNFVLVKSLESDDGEEQAIVIGTGTTPLEAIEDAQRRSEG